MNPPTQQDTMAAVAVYIKRDGSVEYRTSKRTDVESRVAALLQIAALDCAKNSLLQIGLRRAGDVD